MKSEQEAPPRKYQLTFKQNRSFELTVKGITHFFEPHGSQPVDEWVVANMTDHEKLFFNITPIKQPEATNAD